MIGRLSKAAETLATGVSRRSFLDEAGKGALTLAAGLGGLLAASSEARAPKGGSKGAKPKKLWCCTYGPGYRYAICSEGPCPRIIGGQRLAKKVRTGDCVWCFEGDL